MSRAAEILRELVSIPSVSAMSNRPLIEAAARLLVGFHWTLREIPYIDAYGVEKINLIARPHGQEQTDVEIALVCHTDTVPFDLQAWPEATTLIEHDGTLHGCGACDVKGSLAAILAAVAEVESEKITRGVALILTADEEIGCLGATTLLTSELLRAKRVLVCEPTSLRPAVAGKGYGLAEVRVVGKEAHSAFPLQGSSAVYAAAQMMLSIQNRREEARNALFDPPWTTYNVGVVQGGTAKNIIPGECRFLVEWRPLPEEYPSAAMDWLKELAAQTERSQPGCRIEIEARRADAGFAYPAGSPFVRSLSQRFNREPIGISFGSEATRFARIAEEVVVIGPGNMHTAHSDRECIPATELEAFALCIEALLLGEIA